MGELIIQGIYLRLRPAEARRWYRRYAGKETAGFVPALEKTYGKVRRALTQESEVETRMIELVRTVMKETDKWGAHPSQEVLEQIMTQSDTRLILGSKYEPNSCRAALDRGLLMTLLLIEELYQDMTPDGEEDVARRKSLWDERQRLMGSYWDAT
jgi:hypothetical protein